jgi:hypothetical protein
VFDAANPGDGAFDAHAETSVWYRAVAAKVKVPIKRFLRQAVSFDLLFEKKVTVSLSCPLTCSATCFAFNHYGIYT